MIFKKYQHVERYGTTETNNIECGTCYIFPKVDGTNSSVWLNDGEIKAGSRNRELTLENDNAGFYAAILQNEKVKAYLQKHPTHRLFGEWLVPHTLRTYKENAWKKFYIFDVCVDTDENEAGLEYLPYNIYQPLLEEFSLDYIAPIKIVNNSDYDTFTRCLDENDFLIKDGCGIGEGIVIKNYDFYNAHHRQIWGKIIASEFKEKRSTALSVENKVTEQMIVDEFITSAFVEKEYAKIVNDNDGWTSKMIPQLLGKIWYELINEEMWNIIKKFKNPNINFKFLNSLVITKIKNLKPEIFG